MYAQTGEKRLCRDSKKQEAIGNTHKNNIVLWFGFCKKHERKNDNIKGGVTNNMSVVLGYSFIFLFV